MAINTDMEIVRMKISDLEYVNKNLKPFDNICFALSDSAKTSFDFHHFYFVKKT